MQDKITAVIESYFADATWSWRLPMSITEHAREITAAIMPLVEPDWKDAPEWAKWRTVNEDGTITFWKNQPHPHVLSGYWVDDAGGNRTYCDVDNWQYKIQQRPK